MNRKILNISVVMLLCTMILAGCRWNGDSGDSGKITHQSPAETGIAGERSDNSTGKTDIDGNGVADYAIFYNTEEDDKNSFIEIYLNEQKIYEHETKYWIMGIGPMEYIDLDGDGGKEIFLTFDPMVNSMSLTKWIVLKNRQSGWETMEMPEGTEDMEDVFPVTVTLGSGKFDFIITCEGYEKQIRFDAACNYEDQAVWGEEEKNFVQGSEVGWICQWGVWEIKSGKAGEKECLIATQGIQEIQEIGGEFHMLGKLDIYFNYDINEKIKILDVKFTQDTSQQNVKTEHNSGLWRQKDTESEENLLEFATGLQIVLPKEWKDKIVIHKESEVQSYGGGVVICEKGNAKAGAGGILFLLEYFRYDEDAAGPYEIFPNDKVLGVYQNGEDRYALVFTRPRDIQYIEGNEEMQKVYEEFCTLTDKVQVITENMEGFTKCGLYDLDWIVLSGYEQPQSVEMQSYHDTNYELEYPASWEVREESGEDGSRISFFNETGETIFWIQQGEAWRVDLDRSEEAYKKILEESYQEVEVVELSKTKVVGYDAQKLIFHFVSQGEKRAITRYTFVAGHAFYEMNYMDSLEMMSGSNLGEAVVDSICLVQELIP